MRTIFKKLILAMMLAISLPSFAHEFEVDGIYYSILSSKTVKVTYRGNSYSSYTNEYSGSVTIPETVTYSGKTYSVTEIGDYAFYNCSGLTSVTIGDSVTSIGNSAFEGCSYLTEVNITDLVAWCKIGFGNRSSNPLLSANHLILNGTEITNLVIPDGITEIKSCAFTSCSGLSSVTIGDSVTKIGGGAFTDCIGLTSVTIGDSVTEIGGGAFSSCSGLSSVTIGDSVTSIGNYAFSRCSGLTEVTIPNSVTKIDDYAFYGCSGLTSVTIGNSVTSIGERAFYDCSGLTEVTIPNSVTSIGYEAFYYCSGLTSVTIGDSVTSIGNYAFAYCRGLTEVTIPNSVTSIGNYAFRGCSNLTEVNIGNSVTSIGNYAFDNCSGLTEVTIPNSVTSIGYKAFSRCSGLTSINVESENSKYDSRDNCNAIIETETNTLIVGCQNTMIPNSVTEIGGSAFSGCSGLTSVTIPNSVTKIGELAFSSCSSLKYVDYNAKNLLNVGISTNLSYAKTIIVGEDVETIPAGIINSSAATTIISKNTIPPVCDSNAFSSVNKSKCTLYVPTTSYVDYWSADVWKEFTNIKPFIETTSITFDAENYKIETGESLQINANIAPSEASIMDLIWTSSNPEIATVSSTGKVVGILPGEVTITARTIDGSNLIASCTVTVETVLAESIKLSQTEVELAPYETVVLTYTILPKNTTNKSVTWSYSDESIATFKVNNDGSATVLMLKDDKVVITVTTNDGSNLSASCVVGKISGVEDVYVEEVAVTVEDGEIVVKNVTGIVTVYNITGIAVASETADGNEVRFDNLQPGVYIVVVNNKSVKVVL